MSTWFHRLFNPHCEHCIDEKVCQSCEILKQELALEREEKKALLQKLLDPPKPVEEVHGPPVSISVPTNIPWRTRRQMLEAEDREKAKILRQAPKPIEELENALESGNEQVETR